MTRHRVSLLLSGLMRLLLALGVAIVLVVAFTVAASDASETAASGIRVAASGGTAAERHLAADRPFTAWLHDPALFAAEEGDRREMREVDEEEVRTVKLENLVPDVHFGQGEVRIPDNYLDQLREVLDRMRDRRNVRLHFIGHADALPLSAALTAIYGDNVGLSRERAGTVAEYCQRALSLPPAAVSYEGVGASRPVADNGTEAGRQRNRRVEVQVWYDEIDTRTVLREVVVPSAVNRVKVCRTETVCMLRYRDGHSNRARIRNLVAPLHYDEGMADVPEAFLARIRQARANLNDKSNVTVKFIGYTDNRPLTGRDRRIYGDPAGLSKAAARRVALAVRDALGLPDAAVASEGRGAERPVAANDTPQGRALNRRVEVEFWHDDPLQQLPGDPQICPDAAGAETVTRVHDIPGGLAPILFAGGEPVIPDGYTETLRRILDEVGDRTRVRLRFTGFTSNERLDRRTAAIYGDDVGLSLARARRAMAAVVERMDLAADQAEFDGRGYVQSEDVVNAGFVESDISRVQVQVVYDELVLLDDYEGVEVTPITREVRPSDPFALNLMRITVDGKPLDDPGKCRADVQRCTDVALDDAQIRFAFDSLSREPRLNVTAWPVSIGVRDLEATAFVENRVTFRLYSNYRSFIARAEVRIFAEGESVRDVPLAVVGLGDDGEGTWQPDFASFSAPVRKLRYLVRVYDGAGRFDETVPQELWVVDRVAPPAAGTDPDRELLAGYGESRIARRSIPLRGGTVRATGSAIPDGYRVWLAGHAVPVDDAGRFVAEEILPRGLQTVEVAVLDPAGNGELFLRDLELETSDWFTVGIADLTLAANETNGPAELLAPDRPQYGDDLDVQGRLAFYTNGTFGDGWSLTASADTREGPLDEIFSNFVEKSPDALLRRIDPDRHVPTYGDDGTVIEDAPTLGKFFLEVKRDENRARWGNFHIAYTENDLAHVDRGLYGGNLHYRTRAATAFGEPRVLLDGFAADPGTVAGRDEFRGTGGSLYFLRRSNILEGSERLRIEVRDKDSGIVLQVKNLVPVLDYDIDTLQGRILLATPLPATADDGLLVQGDAGAGHPAYLVARYEFTPGFEETDILATGGRMHAWLNDHVRIGVTGSLESEANDEDGVAGADLILRRSASTWLRVEAGRSNGPGVLTTRSIDGGFDFTTPETGLAVPAEASANRVEASVDLADLFGAGRGRMTAYRQELEAGYSAPGLATDRDQVRTGGALDLPVGDRLDVRLKADRLDERDGLETEAGELNLAYRAGEHWTVSTGVRHDSRRDHAPLVPATQEEGNRTDAVARVHFDSRTRWTTYGYVQETVASSGNRDDNGRVGVGGRYRLSDRFTVAGDVSDGDLGAGGQLETEYLYSDRTTLYSRYSLENERSDNGLRARKGNMTSGFRSRYSDSLSVFLEERYTHGDAPSGLTHSTGVDLAPTDRLNLGATLDVGTLKDPRTAAETRRRALGVSAGYGVDALALASAVEYRVDETEQPDTGFAERTTWLVRNSLHYQVTEDWRLTGTFNYAESESSLGDAYNGDYAEAVIGSAYRPVRHDRLNLLLKYTWFYNVPAPGQTVGSDPGFAQRSHIGSLDVMYDLTPRWTIGAKYAQRRGEVALDPADPEYVSSRASLYVLRADWHVLHRWDVLAEARLLDLPDAQDRRSGALLGIYRHLGRHVKLGVGYNFSDFSDDLTRFDYDHQGLFINLIGKI